MSLLKWMAAFMFLPLTGMSQQTTTQVFDEVKNFLQSTAPIPPGAVSRITEISLSIIAVGVSVGFGEDYPVFSYNCLLKRDSLLNHPNFILNSVPRDNRTQRLLHFGGAGHMFTTEPPHEDGDYWFRFIVPLSTGTAGRNSILLFQKNNVVPRTLPLADSLLVTESEANIVVAGTLPEKSYFITGIITSLDGFQYFATIKVAMRYRLLNG